MKKILTLLLLSLVIVSTDVTLTLAQKPKTEISSVKQKGEIVRFSLISSKPFVFGNNRYILYIGDNEFMKYEQLRVNGKGLITFFIPSADFKKLPEASTMYLTYGKMDVQNGDAEELAKGRRCWSLGKFNQTLLTK